MAAYAAASKVDSFAEMPALNLGQAMTNFTAIFCYGWRYGCGGLCGFRVSANTNPYGHR